jgi:hypothetical protein
MFKRGSAAILRSKFLYKNFSVFDKLKQFLKFTNDSTLFSTNVNPENIRAEYEEVDKILQKKKHQKIAGIENPNEIICNIILNKSL